MFHRCVQMKIPVGFRALSNVSDYRPTIFALSTHLARSAIGVIRISGSQAPYIFHKLTNSNNIPNHRVSSLRRLIAPKSGVLLDEALTLFFKGPKSYTGEDLLELHVHGGVAIIKTVLNEIKALHDPTKGIHIRYAENGEFSHRAFLNGRFDLTELEGVREMIDAETESQRVSALSSMTGQNKQIFMEWRQDILNNIALLTTVIDFGEEHDLEEVATLFEQVSVNILAIRDDVNRFLEKVTRSEVLLKGIKLTLLGPPNAGKSSLLNLLANKEAAIVSSIAGTTRDAIDIPMDIGGYKVIIGDTAGVRDIDVTDEIEREGIRRAKQKGLESDVALVVLPMGEEFKSVSSQFVNYIKEMKQNGINIFGILNKEDLVSDEESKKRYIKEFGDMINSNIFTVSCKTNNGTEELMESLIHLFKTLSLSDNSDPISVSERVKDLLLNDVLYGFDQFESFRNDDDVVLATECLRQSVEGIGKITGETIGVEEILGVVFSSFCIGK